MRYGGFFVDSATFEFEFDECFSSFFHGDLLLLPLLLILIPFLGDLSLSLDFLLNLIFLLTLVSFLLLLFNFFLDLIVRL